MTALYKVLGTAAPVAEAPAPREPTATESTVKNIALFFLAPFVALAYIIMFPFVGLAMLVWIGARAAAKRHLPRTIGRIAKKVGLFIAAPLVALAYVVLLPFVGLAMLAWLGGRAMLTKTEKEVTAVELYTVAAAA